jgi:hypothetical protein
VGVIKAVEKAKRATPIMVTPDNFLCLEPCFDYPWQGADLHDQTTKLRCGVIFGGQWLIDSLA